MRFVLVSNSDRKDTRIARVTMNEDIVKNSEWIWTKRLGATFGIVLFLTQFLIGLYLQMTLPAPHVDLRALDLR